MTNKFSTRLPWILLVSIALASISFGIDLMGTNIFEYREASEGHSFFEDRLDMLVTHENLVIGARFSYLEPSRLDMNMNSSKYKDVTHRYVSYMDQNFSITAGTYYETLGRGIVLNLFEDRRLVIDRKLDGAKFSFNMPYVSGRGFYGMADWDEERIFQGGEITVTPPFVVLGATWLDHHNDEASSAPTRENLYSGYAELPFDFVNGYVEYAERKRVGAADDGSALYASLDAYAFDHSILVEYKKYEEFATRSRSLLFNNAPTCLREQSFTLPSKHAHNQNMSEEEGFGVQLMGSYPHDIELDVSYSSVHEIEDTDRSYSEIFGDISHSIGHFENHYILVLQDDKIKDEKYTTGILYGHFQMNKINSIGWDFELQSSELNDEDVMNYHFGLEGTILSDLIAGVEFSMLEEFNIETLENEQNNYPWVFIKSDHWDNHSITLGAGKRSGGFTCAGGICRYEPAFEGFELSISSSF